MTRLIAGLFAALLSLSAQAEETLSPGDVFRDCPKCPEMKVLPAGLFVMGTNGRHKRERPARRVRVAKPFAIGVSELTFDSWQACLDDGGCKHVPDDHDWGRGNRPVINVKISNVENYIAWINAKTGKTYRLPSEAEWEYAARGGTTTEYWWGDEVGKGNVNCRKCGTKWSGKGSAPTRALKPNPFGLYEMNGNIWEWVGDCWNENHEGAPKDASTRTTGDCKYRVMRGGSWYYYSKLARSSYRFKNGVNVKSYNIGFRLVREIP